MQEEYFPRGGFKPKVNNDIVKSDNLFHTLHNSKKKRKHPKENNEKLQISTDTDESLHLTSADLLSYDKILPGMLILGCIRNISPYSIQVELPGLTFAKIGINAISDTLTKNLLAKAKTLDEFDIAENVLTILSKIFTRGQYLPLSVLDVTENENASKQVSATINPKHINLHVTYKIFRKGMLVWGCISEISDYVYIIDLGVKNTRVSLPFNSCQNETYIEGQPSWFVINELQMQDKTATITVSPVKDEVYQSIDQRCHLDQILPGTCVEFSVSKVLKDGLEGVYFNDYIGYINQIYFKKPLEPLEKYKDGVVKAYVLYVHPTTKFSYLTMRSITSSSETNVLANGHMCSAKITHKIGKGVVVKLHKQELGLVTYKRLVQSLKLNDTSDLSDLVKKKFPIGSTHHCRILDYINMNKMYVCTFEKNVLKEEVFNTNDLKPGQLVKGLINEINKFGVAVKIGKLIGFATNEHLSNVEYSDNIKKAYHIGDSVNARIWDVNGNSIKLTLKPAFVNDDRCLTSYQVAKKYDQYPGMIVKSYQKGALICFYGGVKGWLKHSNLEKDCTKMFYHGQMVTVAIALSNAEKLTLTLDVPEKVNNKKILVGQVVSGSVESINKEGLFIRTTGNFQGFLPMNQLSSDVNLSKALFDLYDVGDKINNLICIGKENRRILSMREYNYYKTNKLVMPKRNQLEPGLTIRCSVKSFGKKRILLSSPILFHNGDIIVNKKDIMDVDELLKDFPLSRGQSVLAKVTSVDENQIMATMKLSEVYNYNYKHPVNLLSKYLKDVDKISRKLIADGDALAQYKIGQAVICRIMKISNVGCSVTLDDGIKGIVAPEHWPSKPLINSVHPGVVMYINYVDKYLEISLDIKTNQQISKVQDIKGIEIGQTLYAKMLLIRPEFVLCCLNQRGNRQICYMPTKLHENDFNPNFDYYRNLNNVFKYVVCSTSNGHIIGLEKSLKSTLESKALPEKNSAAKRKRGVSKENLKSVKRSRLSISTVCNSDSQPLKENSIDHTLENEINSDVDVGDEINDDSCQEMSVNEDEEGQESDDEISSEGLKESEENGEEESESVEEEIIGNDHYQKDEVEESESEEDNKNPDISITTQKNTRSSCNGIKRQRDRNTSPEESKQRFLPPSIKNFFDSDDEIQQTADSSDEEILEEQAKSKKKKLTRAEQVELINKQEEELRQKEIEFANPTGIPQSAEQFDRRLLAEPNSSELWTQYISFHLASAEIEKARAAIKRALQTIDVTAGQQDRLNVWIASLNLECYYGTKDTFSKVFDEAVRCNDDFTIYMQAIKILSASGENSNTLDEYVKKCRAKFKQEPKMYIEIGRIYYNEKRFEEARKLKNTALKTITNIAEHIPVIVQFGIMEFNLGEDHHAEVLFETILQSNPKRVDVWCTYVDQLIKKDKIDIARRVLERAVSQNLNIKKMKSLHKKFHEFEKNYGNDETRAQQRKLLEDYTKRFGNLSEQS